MHAVPAPVAPSLATAGSSWVPVAPLGSQLVVLGGLLWAVEVGVGGVAVALTCALLGWTVLARSLAHHGRARLGPADHVTVTRGTLACVVAALTADSALTAGPALTAAGSTSLVLLAAVALSMDAVDGWVARRTGTASELGARMDMEVDAFLILVLSVAAGGVLGWWVLAIGAFRYALVVATWVVPWLGGAVRPRYSRKAIAALQGIVLTVAVAGVLPDRVAATLAAAALALLAWSFGTQCSELWRARLRPGGRSADAGGRPTNPGDRSSSPAGSSAGSRAPRSRRGVVRVAGTVVSVLAVLLVWLVLVLVWLVLVAPDDPGNQPLTWLVRLPVEPVLLLALLLVLPSRWRRPAGLLVGGLLGLLTLVKLLDIGFTSALRRPFDLLTDWTYLQSARDLVGDATGPGWATAALVGAAVVVLAPLVVLPLSVGRLARELDGRLERHRLRWTGVLAVTAAVWVGSAAAQLQVAPGLPLASTSSVGLVADHVSRARAGVRDRAAFARVVATDRFATAPAADLLTGLRGKDVLLVFVESYGEVAVTGSPESVGVSSTLDRATRELGAEGYSTRSAWLDSPTFGGTSWLAHSTLQSGVWVDSQRRYDQLVATHRLTLSSAFQRAGWRTVAAVPSNTTDWPQATSFYRYDQVYDARNVGYAGPRFGYARMPDQYTLKAFADRELTAGDRPPVMAEIDLVTSHVPWAPLPRLVDWTSVGDGSVFGPIRAQAATRAQVWRDPEAVRAAYGESISYSLESLVSFVKHAGDDDLVLVLLGDHQPSTVVSGPGASHKVPITLVAHDPAVTGRVADWDWQEGMRPGPDAPVWPMDAFRDRVLTTFGTSSGATPASTR